DRDYGGGIYNDLATLTISNAVVGGHRAFHGGGIFNRGDSGYASLQIIDSSISGNLAEFDGGGIYNRGVGGNATLWIANSTFNDNRCNNSGGGGILSEGYLGRASVQIVNSTFSRNGAIWGEAILQVSGST